ncbi:MAG TPA: hypothetical protein VGE91_04705 [Solirubrobacterales bacterium]|jgi:hypothetical protein
MAKHPHLLLLPFLALAVGLTAVAAGCSSASGAQDSGGAFDYTLPGGWKDESDRAAEVGPEFGLQPAAVRSIAAMDSASPFTVVFVVITPPGLGDLNLDQFAHATVREVQRASTARASAVAGGTPPTAVPGPSSPGRLTRTEVAGVPAMQFDYESASSSGNSGRVRNIAVVHDGTPYLLRFVSVTPNFDTDIEDLEEILESWQWN